MRAAGGTCIVRERVSFIREPFARPGGAVEGAPIRGFQLWMALSASLENGPTQSRYLSPEEVPVVGPARVVLGRYGDAQSPVPSPEGMTYLAVSLAAGERWQYRPPTGHTGAFLAVHTSEAALREGEANIVRIGLGLRAEGRI